MVREIFDEADEDADGVLSESECGAADLARYGVSFERSDLDADGGARFAEYLELYERHHPEPSSPTSEDLSV